MCNEKVGVAAHKRTERTLLNYIALNNLQERILMQKYMTKSFALKGTSHIACQSNLPINSPG